MECRFPVEMTETPCKAILEKPCMMKEGLVVLIRSDPCTSVTGLATPCMNVFLLRCMVVQKHDPCSGQLYIASLPTALFAPCTVD